MKRARESRQTSVASNTACCWFDSVPGHHFTVVEIPTLSRRRPTNLDHYGDGADPGTIVAGNGQLPLS